MSSDEWSQLLAEVPSRGDPVAGERVFRRQTLGCLKCHSIGGAGGRVGPDLMSLGASAPQDYIAESLVHPNRKIKEGYDTSLIILENGQVLNGMVIGEVGDHFLLRNADNTVVKVLRDKIEEKITQPVSLMPPGLTDPLAEQEFLDLVRFLTEIGKSERFRVPTTETVRSWQTFVATAPVDERSLLADSSRIEWTPAYSEVNGYLPVADLSLVGSANERSYVTRFQVEVHRAGEIGWRVEAGEAFRLWIDGRQVSPVEGLVRVNLEAGHHRVVLQIDAGTAPDRIRVTRSDPPNSKAQSVFKLN
jgi:putative heme-binding domain-containing protein